MENKVKTFIINLDFSTERKEFMDVQLKLFVELDYIFWKGIYGKKMTSDDLNNSYNSLKANTKLGRDLSSGEIGVALSHIEIYKYMINNYLQYSLIMEDDINISPYLSDVLPASIDILKSDAPTIILLTPIYNYVKKRRINKIQGRIISIPYGDYCWAAGYLINHSAAKILAQNLFPVYTPADDWSFFKEKFKINIFAVNPYVISFSKIGGQWNSIIDESNERKILWQSKKRKNYLFLDLLVKMKRFGKYILLRIIGVRFNDSIMFDYNGIKVPKF